MIGLWRAFNAGLNLFALLGNGDARSPGNACDEARYRADGARTNELFHMSLCRQATVRLLLITSEEQRFLGYRASIRLR